MLQQGHCAGHREAGVKTSPLRDAQPWIKCQVCGDEFISLSGKCPACENRRKLKEKSEGITADDLRELKLLREYLDIQANPPGCIFDDYARNAQRWLAALDKVLGGVR
jgi:predicted ATP-dependent serine protease